MAYNDVSESGMNFVTLQQMINDYIVTMQEDDYDSSASDVVIRNFALRGIRELGFDLSRRIKSLKLAVNTTNKTVDLPDDFVNWVKVGVVGDDGIESVVCWESVVGEADLKVSEIVGARFLELAVYGKNRSHI